MQDKISGSLRILLVLFLVSLLHLFGKILGGLWIVSDGLLVIGAITSFKLFKNKSFRDSVLEEVEDIDLGGLADSVSLQIISLLAMVGLLEDKDEDGDVDVEDLKGYFDTEAVFGSFFSDDEELEDEDEVIELNSFEPVELETTEPVTADQDGEDTFFDNNIFEEEEQNF